jgi:TetR/AcrR family transcriptional repressor of nem operon
LADSCGFPALVSEAAHASAQFRAAYERELHCSLDAICGEDTADAARREEALTLMIICVGGLSLSRAVGDEAFSAQILRAARRAAARLANSTAP